MLWILPVIFFSLAGTEAFHFGKNNKNELLVLAPQNTSVQQASKDLGVGPIKKVVLGPIDEKMVAEGKEIFNSKCIVCHDLKQKKIGPPLGDVTKIRTPEFIMNMLIATTLMQQKDAIIKDLIKEYKIPMTPPEISKDQARSVLEYLRSVAK